MSAAAESLGPLARLGTVLASLAGGAAAGARRREALARLQSLGLPTPRDEAWKYTNLRVLGNRPLEPAPVRPFAADAIDALPPREGPTLILVDGRCQDGLSGAMPPGLRVSPLAALLSASHAPNLERRLGAGSSVDERVRLLNTALLDDGIRVEVAANAPPELALHVVHVSTGGGAYPRVLLELAPGARLSLFEYHVSAGATDSVSVPVADLELGEGSLLAHYSLGLGNERAIRLEDVSVNVGRDARYRHRHVGLGGSLARLDLRVALAAPGASAELAGLFLARDQHQLDVRTLVEHRAPHTKSDQIYRGVAADRGRGSYDGKVIVQAGAAKSDSRQSSRNLLLSPRARIDTRPQLEINADDVKCSHGATTGSLDEQMLFYLLSRGLGLETARALLTFAFAEDVIGRLDAPALRRYTEEQVLGRLPAAELIREFVS